MTTRLSTQQIQELFEAQARSTPEAVAVIHEGRALRYADLNARANQLARYLVHLGVGPEQVVGICINRDIEMVVGLLGILKAGAAYVPLDPHYPRERLQHMLEDAAPQVVLTTAELQNVLPPTGAQVIAVDTKLQEIRGQQEENLRAGLSTQDLVYVIYTSGSTGKPKGTAMSHRSMVNLIEWHRSTFGEGAGKRVLQFAALSFDVAFQEIFTSLCTGATLVLLDEWVRRDARALAQLLDRASIHRLFVPPLVLQSLAEHCESSGSVPQGLQDVITAGEQLRITAPVTQLFQRLAGCRLHNHYGPTETHVVTALTLESDSHSWPALPSIGRPIWNTQIYILDEQRQPVPMGATGEIYIAGAGVANGYLRRPELTRERFLEDPFKAEPGARMYKTGDLGRWKSDGTLEYLGRNDQQVKIRGFRIELAEIEAQLTRHEQVKEATVVAREDARGHKRLVAYLTVRAQRPSSDQLRAHLESALPQYMVPAAFVVLDKMPVSPNGKLDQRALPDPDKSDFTTRQYETLSGEKEELLGRLWRQLLNLEFVGRNDNFFELGGDSLLIAQLLEQLRRVGFGVDVRHAFESRNLADLANRLTSYTVEVPASDAALIPPGCAAITPQMLPLVRLQQEHIFRIERAVPGGAANIQDIYPLAPMQEGMLFHHLLAEQGADTYVLPILLSFTAKQKLNDFVAAAQNVIDRHDILRSLVMWEDLPDPVQVVCRNARLPVGEIPLDPTRDPLEQLRARMQPQLQRLDLRAAPLMRLTAAANPHGQEWYAVLQVHHILCDHESLDAVFAEVHAFLEGRGPALPVPVPYREHVANVLRQRTSLNAEAFFRSRLGEIDEPTAPFGLLEVRGEGGPIEQASINLDPDLAQRLLEQARRRAVSPATVFHACWALVVALTSGRDDVVFGTLLLGRLRHAASAQQALGMFMNTLPVRLRLDDTTAAELVARTHRELIELLAYEQTSLTLAQRCGSTGSAPLFSALLNYRHSKPGSDSNTTDLAPGVQILELREWTNYPVSLSVDDLKGAFTLTGKAQQGIDPRRILGYVSTAMRALIGALETGADTPVLRLPVLPEHEWRQIIQSFNATEAAYPEGKLLHELFEEQVRAAPNALALRCREQRLTYAQLNEQANKLARYIGRVGAGQQGRVGIFLERGISTVVAVLGVLKSGAAYIPLDPNNPRDRLEHIIEDSMPGVVLSEERFESSLQGIRHPVVYLDQQAHEIAAEDGSDITVDQLTSGHLAYIMYTSGSTGRPKGVMVCHRNLVNYSTDIVRRFDVAAGSGSLIATSMSFDLCLTGLFPPLICGRPVTLCAEEDDLSQVLLSCRNLSPVKLTPTHLKLLALSPEKAKDCVRTLVLGGEALTGEILRWWRTHSPATRVFNHYGPTETTIGCAVHEVLVDIQGPVPIGRPISNTRIYILNRHGQPVPVGVAGEICVAGAGVTQGYWNQSQLTAERFISDPFTCDPGGPSSMYRTGDLGRWRADGAIEYLGRNDSQVKIRGFRIELGEIEAQLARHPQVANSVVIVSESAFGERSLVAYAIAKDAADAKAPVTADALRAYLKTNLPEPMVPSAFVMLERFPMTPNGKLDRRALPVPERPSRDTLAYEPPRTQMEKAIAPIWAELLHLERVGLDDDFFALGGHSLLAMQLVVRLRSSLSMAVPMKLPFGFPTLRQLAAQVQELRRTTLLAKVQAGGIDVQSLLNKLGTLSDSAVQKMLRELQGEVRS